MFFLEGGKTFLNFFKKSLIFLSAKGISITARSTKHFVLRCYLLFFFIVFYFIIESFNFVAIKKKVKHYELSFLFIF